MAPKEKLKLPIIFKILLMASKSDNMSSQAVANI